MSSKERITHVSILVPHGSGLLGSIVGLFNIFSRANDHAEAAGAEPVFDVHLVGLAGHAELYGGQYSARPDLTLAEVAATDLAIVPALAGNIGEGIKRNAALISWIKEQYRTGAEIAGLCTGALFVADTGLIGDRHCSAQWFVDAAFRRQFSQMNLVAEKTASHADAICSSGGAYTFFRKLLECRAGRQTSSACASAFEAEFNRDCQSVVTISDTRKQRSHRGAGGNHILPADNSADKMTAKRFASMFEVIGADREGSASRRAPKHENHKANSTAFRELFRRISSVDKGNSING